MPSATDYTRIRRDVDANSTVLPNDEIDDLFVEAGEIYTTTAAILASTRVLFLQGLFASASKMNDYIQNNSAEKASQVFDHVEKLLKYWTGKLGDAALIENRASGAARFAGKRIIPTRVKEWPDG